MPAYIEVDIVFRLFIHHHAAEELRALRTSEPVAAARLVALLDQLAADQDLMDRLTQHDFGSDRRAAIQVSKWLQQWNQGRDIWRLKDWSLEDRGLRYRLIYAYIRIQQQYHVLAIAPRDFNYEPTHPITKRILCDYEEL